MDGLSLPTLYLATALCDDYVDGGSLALQRDGQFALTIRTRRDCAATGGGVSTSNVSSTGEWALTDSLRLTAPQPAAPLVGVVVRADILRFDGASLLPGQSHSFRFGSGTVPNEQ